MNTEIFKYIDRVINFIEVVEGKAGLEKVIESPNAFKDFAKAYNNQCISSLNKVLNLEGKAKHEFFSEIATNVFIRVHTQEQNKRLMATSNEAYDH